MDPPPWEYLTGTERCAACITAARAGNRGALAALVADLTPLVWHVARANGASQVLAEDVVQTVWLDVVSHLDMLVEPRSLLGWLVTATRREAACAGGFEDAENGRVWQAIARLPARCQEMLRLTGADDRVVAAALDIPEGSVRTMRGRCLRAFHELLAADGSPHC